MNNYKKNRWLLVLAIIVGGIALLWLNLLITRHLWDYVTDHMFAGAQEAGLIADTLTWAEAFVLNWFGALVSGSAILMAKR